MNELITLAILMVDGKLTGEDRPVYTNHHIPIQIVFSNEGTEPACILNQFEPIPIFFTVQITNEDGTIIDLPGGGKIAIDKMDYIHLRPRDTFVRKIDIATTLTSPLNQGRYTLSLLYHNQYGQDPCFRGYLESNTVEFEIVSEEFFAVPQN